MAKLPRAKCWDCGKSIERHDPTRTQEARRNRTAGVVFIDRHLGCAQKSKALAKTKR